MEIDENFKVYSFTQEPFLKEYILRNIELRKQTTCKMESDLFKLFNNSIFGKCLTNVVHYSTNVILCTNKKTFLSYLCSPYFLNYTVISDKKIIITTRKRKIRFSYPTYLGFSILEKSQRYMKTVYYDYIKKIFKNNKVSLLYSDTDSFYLSYNLLLKEYLPESYFYERYKILEKLKNAGILDTSNFHVKHPLYSVNKKGALFHMKLENMRIIYGAFIGIAPKVYNFDVIPYHLYKVINELKNKSLNKIVNVLYIQKTCCIFEIEGSDNEIFKSFEIFLSEIEIMLEGWYPSILNFCKFIEYHENSIEDGILTLPKCEDFYSNKVLEFI